MAEELQRAYVTETRAGSFTCFELCADHLESGQTIMGYLGSERHEVEAMIREDAAKQGYEIVAWLSAIG